MLDLDRLNRIRLHRRPLAQLMVANTLLRWDYRWPRRTEIVLEGLEHLPTDRGVFLAMNHTDRYNYWPAQYEMYRRGQRFTATWVKGKYYENGLMARFLDANNNIPLPSRGYVLTMELAGGLGRKPTAQEYRWLRDLVDGGEVPAEPPPSGVTEFLHRAQYRDPAHFLERFDHLFDQMVARVVELNRQALTELNLNVLVFPQGTRSVRLSRGHTGLMHMAMHLGAAIVPIGCNGSDRVYPGNSPFAKGGRIVYRFGPALAPDGPELAPFRIQEPFRPLSREAGRAHGPAFQAATDVLMERINGLLDPPYQWSDDQRSDGVGGVERFV